VKSFASDQELFFDSFADAVVKLSQLDVLTGKKGQVRAKCSVANTKKEGLVVASVVEEDVDLRGHM